ncbi:UNVERIFIED_CONTAM: putative metal-dependent phosphoesterase TrpH [Brevibacillus sp. OAP136]
MSQRADLHTHTLASDGTNAPAENVRLAKKQGLAAVAITDHDTAAGIAEAVEAGKEEGIEVIPGVEISSVAGGQDIHVLGYFIPYESAELHERLARLRDARHERNKLIVERLRSLGIDITLEAIYAQKQDVEKNIGRPHIAEELVRLGVVESIAEAFDKYLGKGGAAYTTPKRMTPEEAIKFIREAGGAAVLAHPGLYGDDELVESLIVYGLDGIEVWHPDHDEAAQERYRKLGEEYGLILTGGSDFHGWRGEEPYHAMLGSNTAEMTAVEKLRKIASLRMGR